MSLKKGLIKIRNFKKYPDKIRCIYLLITGRVSIKIKLTINFIKRKIREYDEL